MSATPPQPPLTDPFRIGDVEIANRVLLAPLAGIGNWFVRLQAKRHGAGLAVSEMVSSFGLHHRNERTLRELMRIHPDEHPVSVQLFGHDAEVMRSGAAVAAEAGADLIDINMGCPVRKVRRTGAGVELLTDPELALALARGAAEGSGLPVTVKLRSGLRPGDRSGFDLAVRLAEEAGVAAIGFHPRPGHRRPQGRPRLRPDPRAGRAPRGPGDRLRRPEERRGGPPRPPRVRRRRGDDRPRGARQPLGLRGADRPPRDAARGARRSPPSCSGRWTAPRSTWAPSARPATCASSTPGTWKPLGAPTVVAEELQRSADLPRARELIATLGAPAAVA